MICPRCQFEFSPNFQDSEAACPDCGIRVARSVAGVMKTSAVLISARGKQGFYRSVQDVPEPLRTELLTVTTSRNAGMIVIADKAGRERLELERMMKTPTPEAPPAPVEVRRFLGLSWVVWAGLCLALGVAAILAMLFSPAVFSPTVLFPRR